MRLTPAAVEGLKLDAGVADKIIFDDDVSRLRHSRARQRGADVDFSVQNRRQNTPPRSWPGRRQLGIIAAAISQSRWPCKPVNSLF